MNEEGITTWAVDDYQGHPVVKKSETIHADTSPVAGESKLACGIDPIGVLCVYAVTPEDLRRAAGRTKASNWVCEACLAALPNGRIVQPTMVEGQTHWEVTSGSKGVRLS